MCTNFFDLIYQYNSCSRLIKSTPHVTTQHHQNLNNFGKTIHCQRSRQCCLQDLKLKICLICSCLGISLQHRHGWTSLLNVFLSFQFIDTAVTNCSKFSIIVVELLANLLHRTSCFANFKGIWLFLFAQSFQWGWG